MAKKEPSTIAKREATDAKSLVPRSVAIAERGITHGQQFAELMSALMTDLVTGAMTPDVANATCNAGGKLLKIVEMQHKYGPKGGGNLALTGPK